MTWGWRWDRIQDERIQDPETEESYNTRLPVSILKTTDHRPVNRRFTFTPTTNNQQKTDHYFFVSSFFYGSILLIYMDRKRRQRIT